MSAATSRLHPLLRFAWPVSGWARGFRITIHDGGGRSLSRRLLHHVNLLHLGRRQFLDPVFERTIAAGQETDDVLLPSSIGVGRCSIGAIPDSLRIWLTSTGMAGRRPPRAVPAGTSTGNAPRRGGGAALVVDQ